MGIFGVYLVNSDGLVVEYFAEYFFVVGKAQSIHFFEKLRMTDKFHIRFKNVFISIFLLIV
ncbi:hypothetical protein D9V86_10135 [Bacteroidetes/Chlorobi group bacterium ChocPot_Mid]|nr:MAG: hypothetical protein D9V86_10135 [Bacteroidetes/Chlorobi group bacterium ChocPot_Mid]